MKRSVLPGGLWRLPEGRVYNPKQAARARTVSAVRDIDRRLARLRQGEPPDAVAGFRVIGEVTREIVEAELLKRRRRLMQTLV